MLPQAAKVPPEAFCGTDAVTRLSGDVSAVLAVETDVPGALPERDRPAGPARSGGRAGGVSVAARGGSAFQKVT